MRSFFHSWLLLAPVLMMVADASLKAAPAEREIEAVIARSLVSKGNTGRLNQAFAKAAQGGKFVVGVIGGSITQGAKATKPEHRYAGVVMQWWRDTFPKAEVELVNAGIGATGSNYGALRVERDLLSKQPDFVIVEYACNDGNVRNSAETLEGLVRQILKAPNKPAVMLLFMTKRDGGNAQEHHAKIGAHYHLPMVSFRDGLWPAVKAGQLKMDDFLADEVHPNDFGHGVAARCVTHLLAGIQAAGTSSVVDRDGELPAPLISAVYEHTILQEAADLKPVANQGWSYRSDLKAWHADQPGSVLELEVKGLSVLLMTHVIRGAMGRVKVQVDGGAATVIDGWFSGTWGGYRSTTALAEKLVSDAVHRVRIELLEEKSAGSTGHGFSIYGLGAVGLP